MRINRDIKSKEIRLIDENSSQVGVVKISDALEMAASQNLDLVEISPGANPPVCKIIDYGKYKFEQAKKEKETKKNQHVVELKEVRLSLNIDINDVNTKLKHARKFLETGNKVKVSLRFRGREMAHTELGKKVMSEFFEKCKDFSSAEKPPLLNGRSMFMVLSPKK